LRSWRSDSSLSQPTQPGLETGPIDRLREVVIGTQSEGRRGLGFHRHNDDRDVGEGRIALEASEELLAAAIREAQVQDDSEGSSAQERVLRTRETAHDFCAQIHRRGYSQDEIRIVAFVVDHQDALADDWLGHDIRKTNVERRSFALFAVEADRPLHLLDEAPGERKAEAGAICVGAGLADTLEHA